MAKQRDRVIETIADLTPDPKNARSHNPRNIGMIESALRELGAGRSILIDAKGEIIAGNGVVEAAAAAGIEKVKVVDATGDEIIAVRRADLTGRRKRRMAIVDNRAAELATWNVDILHDFSVEDDTVLEGYFDGDERSDLFGTIGANEPSDVDAEPQLNKAEELQAEWKVERGQVWLLEGHRLMCGDSRDAADVARLMNGERAALCASDPPYGIRLIETKHGIPRSGYATLAQDYDDIAADNLQDEELQAFLESTFRTWLPTLQPSAAWYIWHAGLGQAHYVAAAATAVGVLLHRQLIWVKPGFNLSRSGMYHPAHECCYYGWVRGQQPPWYGEKNQRSVWEIDRIREKSAHPTCKPPELWHAPITNHTKPGEILAEPFCGSGSQIIAAEQLGRRCYAMEIEEKYCAVTLQRFVDATGQMPTRIHP